MGGYVYPVLTITLLVVALTIWWHVRTRRTAAGRAGEGFDTFCESFATDPLPADVLRAVYAKFQEWCSSVVEEFPVRADDDIYRVYGMVDDDLLDALAEVIEDCGRRIPPEARMRRMNPVGTVRDFAGFVARCPPHAEPVAGRSPE